MSAEPPQQTPYQSPPKPYWTPTKIAALVVIVVVAVSVAGAGFYFGVVQPASQLTLKCSNGATNYPNCDNCPSGQYYNAQKCNRGDFTMAATPPGSSQVGSSSTSTITVTAIDGFTGTVSISVAVPGDLPLGFTCGSGVSPTTIIGSGSASITCLSLIAATPYMTVTGTSGPLSHTVGITWTFIQSSCSNGATNYPQCNMWNSSTSISCTPSTIQTHSLTTTSCHITVSSPSSPTVPNGSVGFTAAGTNAWYVNGAPCTLVLATDYSYCDITSVSTAGPSGVMTIYAGFGGDTSHAKSTGSFDITVVDPPSPVTVSGSVSAQAGCVGCSVNSMTFYDYNTSKIYAASLFPGGTYSISLQNIQTYYITIYWSGTFGSGSCNKTFTLESSTSTWTADWMC